MGVLLCLAGVSVAVNALADGKSSLSTFPAPTWEFWETLAGEFMSKSIGTPLLIIMGEPLVVD